MPEYDHQNLAKRILAGNQKKLPLILQAEGAECGLACLAMISCYHGRGEDLTTLRRQSSISLTGMSLANIIDIADTLELSARPFRIELEDITELSAPCILHWDLSHFVVLKAVSKNHLIIHDPAIGVQKLTIDQASKHFTGIALELTPTTEFKKKKSPPRVRLWDFWSRIVGLKRSMLQILGLSALLQIIALAIPFYSQLAVDEAIISGDVDFLFVLLMGFLLLVGFQCITSLLRAGSEIYLSNMLSAQMQSNTFRHIMRLPLEWFEKRHLGDIASRFDSLEPVKRLITNSLVAAFIDGIMAVTTLTLMLLYSVKITLVVLAGLCVYFGIRLILFPIMRRKSEEGLQLGAQLDTFFLESVRGARAIKLFGKENERQSQFLNAQISVVNKEVEYQRVEALAKSLSEFVINSSRILVIFLAAIFVIQTEFTLGMLFAFLAYQIEFSKSVENLVEKTIEWKMVHLHLDRLSDIVRAKIEKTDISRTSEINELSGRIELRNVSFRYSEHDPYIFENVSIKIKANEKVAIIGGSGEGKTTFLKVILGLLQPTSGEILYDGLPISKIGLKALRRSTGVVMQDDQLLSGSLTENISFFDSEVDFERIVRCARAAAIHEDIVAMTMGYDSLVGDMGSTLSGGQKQRILLARALYRDPTILFLDEGTANLDSTSEQQVLDTISNLRGTQVMIAHHPATLKIVTKVIVLKNGKASVQTRKAISNERLNNSASCFSGVKENQQSRVA